jgi:hypothetical protein
MATWVSRSVGYLPVVALGWSGRHIHVGSKMLVYRYFPLLIYISILRNCGFKLCGWGSLAKDVDIAKIIWYY